MNTSKIFDWIWRINGALLLILLSAACLMIVIQIFSGISWGTQPDRVIKNVADDPEGKENWILGYAQEIYGTDNIAIPLVSENKTVSLKTSPVLASSSPGSYGGYSSPSKNVLFINAATGHTRWLFNSNDQLIQDFEQFPGEQGYSGKTDTTKAIFYDVISIDTNNDKILDENDKASMAISDPHGNQYRVIIDSVDRLISKSQVKNGNIMIIYQDEGIGYSLLYSLESRQVIETKELPKV